MFAFRLVLPQSVDRPRLLEALGVPDDPIGGPPPSLIELGNAATGATAALIDEGGFSLLVPTIRAPWLVDDVIAPVLAQVALLGGRTDPPDAADAYRAARARGIAELGALCSMQGAPPPPFLPAADVARLRALLLAMAQRVEGPPLSEPIYCLDPQDGQPIRTAVRLPAVTEAPHVRLADVSGVLCDLEPGATETPALYPMAALAPAVIGTAQGLLTVDVARARALLQHSEGEAIARFRFVSAVEVVDQESLSGG